jgi:hypothetical protein
MRSVAPGSGRPGIGKWFALLLLIPVTGCGPGRGTVSGRVLYNGAPLPGGRVTFRPADPRQNSISAELDEQGNYEAVLPIGEVKVSVDNRELEPRGSREAMLPAGLPPEVAKKLGGSRPLDQSPPKSPEPAPEKISRRYVKIPIKYHAGETSGIQFTVQSGKHVYDIELAK